MMRGILGSIGLGAWVAFLAGCMTGPLAENPSFIPADSTVCVENPVYVPLGPPAYGAVFEKVLDIVDDYFEIAYANRYDGRIETFPRVSPGLEQPWKPGTPGLYQRLEATTQSIRRRSNILIQPAEDGGFFVEVAVFKELEDLPRPVRATSGAASFRSDNTIDRQFEVIDPTVLETNWIPLGRDACLEQIILQRLKQCM
jgi:hypothetical protein